MDKSLYALAMEKVQEPVAELLRGEGFKKYGRTFNRSVENGMIQVVNFQMGHYPIGKYVIPGIRENHYGSFVVNLGIFLPCVAQMEGMIAKKHIQEYDCHIRERLGALANKPDTWWSLERSPSETGSSIVELLKGFGLPFLAGFINYEGILSYYRTKGVLPFSTDGRSALIAAVVCNSIGDFKSANKYFDTAVEIAAKRRNSGFRQHVEEIRKLCLQ